MCKCEAKSTALEQKHTEQHIQFPCLLWVYRPMNCDQRKQGPNSSPNDGGWGQQSCLRNTCNKHTHTHINQSPLYTALFGLFIWIQEKDKGLCISHCAQKGSYTDPEPGGVSPQCVCCTVCVHLSFFLSFFSIKLSLLLLLARSNRHQQEGRGTDNELNWDLPCLTEVSGNAFRLKIG